MIGVHRTMKPVLIEEYSDDFELLVVEVEIANRHIRIITGYGPQENWPEKDRIPFFIALEKEIVNAELENRSIFIELDANSKLGPTLVPGDMHGQSENGKILAGIIQRHGLIIGNTHEKCHGLVTRKRIPKNTTEESIIDFVLLSEDLIENLDEIKIDDERKHVLTKIVRTKKEISKVESDHNTIFSKFRLKWNKKIIQKRQELYNLKNKECQDLFKEATKSENNNRFLSSVFDEKGDINNLTKKFLKRLDKTIKQCFRKIRIKANDEKSEINYFGGCLKTS